jgi:hypothetical protein
MRKAVLSFLALTSCATHSVHPLRPVPIPTAYYQENAAIEDLAGSLTYEDGCLGFRVEGGEHLLPIWPKDSVFNGTSLVFHMPGKTDQPLLINQEVELGGHRLPSTYMQQNFPETVRCGGVPFFVAAVRPAN